MLTLQIKHLSQSTRARQIALWALSIGLLFFGFLSNVWHVAEQDWFDTHQRDTESLIIGRMVKSRAHEFSAVADALYVLRLCCGRMCSYHMEKRKDRKK